MSVFDLRPAEFIGAISDLAIEHQIDMAMAYCRQSRYWREFVNDPVAMVWIKANAGKLNARHVTHRVTQTSMNPRSGGLLSDKQARINFENAWETIATSMRWDRILREQILLDYIRSGDPINFYNWLKDHHNV
jgi:hypothetical protein